MKTNLIIGVCVVIALLTAGSASAWLDPYTHRQSLILTGGADGAQTDYQIKLAIPYDADMQADFDDLRFTQSDGTTLINAWLESKIDSTSAVVWAEFPTTPANGVNQTYYVYYGNATASSNWDGSGTFLQYHGASSSTFIDSLVVNPVNNYAFETLARAGSGSHTIEIGLGQTVAYGGDKSFIQSYNPSGQNLRYLQTLNDGSATQLSESPCFTSGVWYKGLITYDGTTTRGYWDLNEIGTGSIINLPNQLMGIFLNIPTGSGEIAWAFARNYAANPATYALGSKEAEPIIPSAHPSIVAYNNITGTRSHVPLDHGTTVLFNATTNTSATWSWTLDGVDQGVIVDTYTHTFSAGFGYYAVTVTAVNALGTDTYTWGVWENIETTAETIPTFTDTSYQMLLDSIDYPPDMEEFGKAMAHPFVQMVGVIFYLFIFGIPLLMMYIRQDNMTMPTTLLLLFGSIIIFMLPPQWQIIAGAIMTLGFVGILFKLYKERER